MIERNDEKIRIIAQYKRVSEEISRMFEVISSYSGKEDIMEVV